MYAPDTAAERGWYRPQTFSSASEISPRVQRTRAALIESSNRLPFPVLAHSSRASRAALTLVLSREALT